MGCACDLTKNSCDAYCCCDTDCEETVLTFWRENYSSYCAKNKVAQKYAPKMNCMSKTMLFGYNKRMGMEVTTIGKGDNEQVCVSLDIPSVFTYQIPEIQKCSESQTALDPDISKINSQQLPLNEVRNRRKSKINT